MEKIPHSTVILTLFLICLAVKLTFVFCFSIEPKVDYKTFYDTSVDLSRGEIPSNSRYIALFPHIFGYSSFLSFFFKIFGTSYLVAPIVNAVLSSLSIFLFYYIGCNMISKTGAIISCLIWTFLPSQSFYNIFVLSEPLYTFELLIAFSLMIFIDKRLLKVSYPLCLGIGVLLALVLQLINMARPIAYIPIIAFFLWFFLVRTDHFSKKNLLAKKAGLFATMMVFFFLFSALGNWVFEMKIGEAPATTPGYNICVGFNEDSLGTWNPDDSALLYSYSDRPGWSAVQVQQQMLEEAKDRILHDDINFPNLFFRKFLTLWVNDQACIDYGAEVLPSARNLRALCNAYYYILLLFNLIAVCIAIRKKEKSSFFLICIFMIGLTLAQMLVEVAPRYHYSGLLTFTLLGGYGLSHLAGWMCTHPKKRRSLNVSSK